jgi:hypothetical protein
MNKKLIAIAVASVMAAPVAMADIKISGRVAQDFTITDTDGATNDKRGISDSGHTRLQFDGTAGNAYARIALDERLGRGDHTHDVDVTSGATDEESTKTSTDDKTKRDSYVGYKFGGGTSVQVGRMGGVAKNIEKDPYIATFLETRSTVANSYTNARFGSSSFVDSVAQVKMKAGAATIAVQFGPAEYANDNNGHIGVAVTGKGGPVSYWASYNNGSADGDSSAATYPSQSNIKIGGKMKFGMATVGLNYTSMDKDGTVGTAGNATDSIAVDGNFDLGNGMSANVGVAVRSGDVAADDAEFIRLAVMKKLNKSASIYGGYTTTDYDATSSSADTSEVGVGMLVKF